jgi:hypothetical protein
MTTFHRFVFLMVFALVAPACGSEVLDEGDIPAEQTTVNTSDNLSAFRDVFWGNYRCDEKYCVCDGPKSGSDCKQLSRDSKCSGPLICYPDEPAGPRCSCRTNGGPTSVIGGGGSGVF